MTDRTPIILPPIEDPSIHSEIDRLARRYLGARNMAMELLERIGGGSEALFDRLPGFVRRRMDGAVKTALERAFDAADASRSVLRDRGDWFNRLGTSASGAIGGAGGIAGALIELPFTVTFLMRAILEIAAEHGLDTTDTEVRAEALRIFASGGPLAADDGADTGLLAARVAVTGRTMQSLIANFAPQITTRLMTKLGAQSVPLLGAVAGASINYAFARYFQQLARVQFGMMRLARETGLPREALTEALLLRIAALEPKLAKNRPIWAD